ncbi:MAG: GIY-YIG nuclease family protein [Robiginitomaculum sp.]|nr:GIY-YIG nuclease family protein [Robiginitomaculum sp.]
MNNNEWCVYILRCGDGSLYTGITNDLAQRIAKHETGKGAKYTKNRGPFDLVYQETSPDRSAATKREMQIKALSRQEKLALISET